MENIIKVINKTDETFPVLLQALKTKCPNQLYTIGNIELLNSNIIAIVGSRNASTYGLEMAKKFSTYLAQKGITIISGMAVRSGYCCSFWCY